MTFNKRVVLAAMLFVLGILGYQQYNAYPEKSCFKQDLDTDLLRIVSNAQVYSWSPEELHEFGNTNFPRVIQMLQSGKYRDQRLCRQYRKVSRVIADAVGYPIGYQLSPVRPHENAEALSAFEVENSGVPILSFIVPNFWDVYQQWRKDKMADVDQSLDHLVAVTVVRQLELAAEALLQQQTAAQ